jgi:hypothetical protein
MPPTWWRVPVECPCLQDVTVSADFWMGYASGFVTCLLLLLTAGIINGRMNG